MVTAGLFAATVVALWLAALRVAARWAGSGWTRAVTAMALLAWACAVLPLLCGLTGLGTSPPALAAAALATAAVAAAAAGPAGTPLTGDLLAAGRAQRRMLWAAGAAAAATLLLLLLRPRLRADPFHLVEVVRWLASGTPGTVEFVAQQFPAGSYPLVNELVLTFGAGVSRSFAVVALWTVALLVTMAVAAYGGLRSRSLGPAAAAVGSAAVVLVAVRVGGNDASTTDLPSATWLVVAAALAVASHPGPAALALGLAVGTKLNVAPVGAAVVLGAFWAHRSRLRPADAAGVAAGLAVAAPWPLRNLVDHGSPTWPFSDVWPGDPLPGVLGELQEPFLREPLTAARLYAGTDPGLWWFVVGLMGVAAGVLLATKRRDARAAAGAALGAWLVWAASPLSGQTPDGGIAPHFLRYSLPAALCAVAAGALALGPRHPGAPGPPARRPRLRTTAAAAGSGALVLAAAAHGGAGHYVTSTTDAPTRELTRWLGAQPRYADGADPVISNSDPDPRLAGARLDHDLELLPPNTRCSEVRAATGRGWLIVLRGEHDDPRARVAPGETCLRGRRPAFLTDDIAVYSALAAP